MTENIDAETRATVAAIATSLGTLTGLVTDLVDTLRKGRSPDNPALLEDLTALFGELRKTLSRLPDVPRGNTAQN